MINKFNTIVNQQVYKHKQIMYTIRSWFKYSQSSTNPPMQISTNSHKTRFTNYKMHAMF